MIERSINLESKETSYSTLKRRALSWSITSSSLSEGSYSWGRLSMYKLAVWWWRARISVLPQTLKTFNASQSQLWVASSLWQAAMISNLFKDGATSCIRMKSGKSYPTLMSQEWDTVAAHWTSLAMCSEEKATTEDISIALSGCGYLKMGSPSHKIGQAA